MKDAILILAAVDWLIGALLVMSNTVKLTIKWEGDERLTRNSLVLLMVLAAAMFIVLPKTIYKIVNGKDLR